MIYLLKDEISESNISITVDFVNLDHVSIEFREHIDKQKVRI